MGDACCGSDADSGQAKVMNECQRLAGLQAKKQDKAPTPLRGRGELHPLGSGDDSFLYDARIVPKRRHAGAWHSTGNNVGHVSRLVEIRWHLVARTRTVDSDPVGLFVERPLHRVDAIT